MLVYILACTIVKCKILNECNETTNRKGTPILQCSMNNGCSNHRLSSNIPNSEFIFFLYSLFYLILKGKYNFLKAEFTKLLWNNDKPITIFNT